MADKVDVLQFMMLRSPAVPDPVAFRRAYVRDDVAGPDGRHDEDLFSTGSPSPIGRRVYDTVYCSPGSDDPAQVRSGIAALVAALLSDVAHFTPSCPNEPGTPDIGLLRDRTYLVVDGVHYLLPDRASDISTSYGDRLPRLQALLRRAATPPPAGPNGKVPPLDVAGLHQQIGQLFDASYVRRVVFEDDGSYTEGYRLAKRVVFDILYLLYILRRVARVHLDPVMDALGALHALEALAVDSALFELGTVHTHVPPPPDWLVALFPEIEGHRPPGLPPGFPLIGGYDDLRAYLDATPVVHPIFARLHRFRHPFNDVSPVGVGDLKVVKQWLLGYRAGEISHIDNVLMGETKTRVHRHLTKTEEVFTLTSEQQEETTRDTQTTDRFEIKREAENIVKADLNVNAGLNVNVNYQGTGYTIVSTVTGGIAYTRSQTEQAKVASNFARDVIDKAVNRVQSRVSQSRTTSTLFETEETNTHSFENKTGTKHVSAIYRWLDKEYRSRIYNFGRRMMFEFVVPEPAAFLVEAKLRAYETALEVPQPPPPPVLAELPAWVTALTPASITPDEFAKLRITHDLTDMTYPEVDRWVDFVDAATGNNYFSESWADSSTWQARTFTCRLNAKDYVITDLIVQGYVYFWGTDDTAGSDVNTFDLRVDGRTYVYDVNNDVERWYYGNNRPSSHPATGAPPLAGDQVTLFFGFWDIAQYDLSIHAQLTLAPAVLVAWQSSVIARVRAVEQKRIDATNAERRQSYESRLATYRSRLAELRAMAVNDLLQGQSEAFNRQLIVRELKRQCLAMLTKEFDADADDDTILKIEAMGARTVDVRYRQLRVTETPDANVPLSASAAFEVVTKPVKYPVPKLPEARAKGRYVQFLEQAFEWQQLSYICYPYFWASPPAWIELMSRSDDADPFLTAFLQAGSVRVLVAVTPAHDDAVLHYLATGEPWDGGPGPVIGDPLYLPLYEELRRQQDDLANAVPDGDSWTFTLPTSLVYLEHSSTPLPPVDEDDT
ncbi:MAG: hypothetical protein ABW156_09220 [Jiangellaceae bacterium]